MRKEPEKDYNNYDYIHITVKRKNVDEVVSSYGIFHWEEISRNEDMQYHDIIHIWFKRKHKIDNKDKLQLLQVYYENYLNERSLVEKKKHYGSRAMVAVASGLGGLALISVSMLIAFAKSILAIIVGICAVAVELGLGVFLWLRSKKLRKTEKQKFDAKYNQLTKDIESVLTAVPSDNNKGDSGQNA